MKGADGEAGNNARQALRFLEGLRLSGDLVKGVALPSRGTVRLEVNHVDADLPQGLDPNSRAGRVLKVCRGLMDEGTPATLVSRRVGDTLELESGLRIFPGMETDVAEGGHILTIGPLEAILELNRRLEPNKEKGSFLPFARLMDLFDEYPVVVGCGHPFRSPGHVPELPEEQLVRLKFLDLNGKDLALDRERTERLTCALGKRLGIPVVSGSDTHQAVQYGCVTTVFERDCDTIPALYEEMRAGRYAIDLAETASFQVRTACLLKRSLKEIHALGGDYVAVLTREATV